jgi:hypothetical protein
VTFALDKLKFEEERAMEFSFESRPLNRTEEDVSTTADGLRLRRIEAGDLDGALAQYATCTGVEILSLATPRTGQETIVTARRDGAIQIVRVSPRSGERQKKERS